MTLLEFLLIVLMIGTGIAVFEIWTLRKKSARAKAEAQLVAPLLNAHFAPVLTSDITISERKFPFRVRADLQRAIDRLSRGEDVINALDEMLVSGGSLNLKLLGAEKTGN